MGRGRGMWSAVCGVSVHHAHMAAGAWRAASSSRLSSLVQRASPHRGRPIEISPNRAHSCTCNTCVCGFPHPAFLSCHRVPRAGRWCVPRALFARGTRTKRPRGPAASVGLVRAMSQKFRNWLKRVSAFQPFRTVDFCVTVGPPNAAAPIHAPQPSDGPETFKTINC